MGDWMMSACRVVQLVQISLAGKQNKGIPRGIREHLMVYKSNLL